MPTLLIKMDDGAVHGMKVPMHFMVAEELRLDFDRIVDTGIVTKGREIWLGRKPH